MHNVMYVLNNASIRHSAYLDDSDDLITFLLASMVMVMVFCLIWYVIQVIAYWKIFSKMGEPGWKSLIPFYNDYVRFSHTWKPLFFWVNLGLLILGLAAGCIDSAAAEWISGLCSLASFVISVMANNYLSKSFGHGIGFTVGLVLLDPIFKLILAFGGDSYIGNMSGQA